MKAETTTHTRIKPTLADKHLSSEEKFHNFIIALGIPSTKVLTANELCPYCLTRLCNTKEHVIPRSAPLSLRDVPFNVTGACYECNHERGRKSLLSWWGTKFGTLKLCDS